MTKQQNPYESNFKFQILIFIIITCLALNPSVGYTAESVNRKNSGELRLTLKECLALALKNNLDISIERINPLIAETDVVVRESEFDSVFTLSGTGTKTREQRASAFADPSVGETEGYEASAGVGTGMVTGTDLSLELTSGRAITNSSFQGLNPQYSSAATLSITQHLLKDFGIDVNTSSIRIARKNREGTLLQFKDRVIKTLAEVQNLYWDLVLAIEDHKVKRETLDLAKQFEERVRIQVKVGVLAPLEITQARAEVAAREEDVIIAENRVRDVEDRLRRLISRDAGAWNRPIVPTDTPRVVAYNVRIEDEVQEAFANRPDYRITKTAIESRRIELQYKDNQLFPSLDLTGSFRLNGISGEAIPSITFSGTPSQSAFSGDYSKSVEDTGSGKYYAWQVGLTLSFPLGNRRARSEYTAAKLEVEKTLKGLKNMEQQITLEVREAARQIATALKRIQATRLSRELAEEKLGVEEKKFKVGLSTSFNVLEYQRDLSAARTKELLALADHNKARVSLSLVKGTLLEENEIVLE